MQWHLSSRVAQLGRLLAVRGVALFFLVLAAPALAAALSVNDEKRVRAVVQAQLDAFAADDADKAFSYAAPNIRQLLVSAGTFMAMVRAQYPVVYRPATVAFLKPKGRGGEVVQIVQMTDADGVHWLVIYSLQRQKNNLWRITGCAVTGSNARMA